MANGPSDRGNSTRGIVAIVVLVLIGVVVFMIFFWNGGNVEEPAAGPDVELEGTPPDDTGGASDGNSGNRGSGEE